MSEKIKSSRFEFGGTGLAAKAMLAKHLAVMQKSGLPINESLSIAEESAVGKMKNIIAEIKKSVEAGNSLADSFARFKNVFPSVFISSIYAGESSGTLDQNLEHLSEQLEKEKELIAKIKGAMLYPIVVLLAAFVLGIVISFYILPKIIPLFQGFKTELPFTTRLLISFSTTMQAHGVVIISGLVVFLFLFIWLCRQKFSQSVTHWLILRLPIVKKITQNANLARFARNFGMLLKSGLNIDEALSITENSLGNYYYRKSINHIKERVGKGAKLSECLGEYSKLFPVILIKMIYVGEESGKLEETLDYLSNYYDQEVDTSTKSLSTAIEPLLLIFIGLVVGFLALSIITPIYNITGSIGQ